MSKNNDTKYNKVHVKNNMEVGDQEEESIKKKEQLEPVIEKKPEKVQRSLISRLFIGLVGPDGLSGIGNYVGEEIVIPAIKNVIFDSLTSGLNMALYKTLGGNPSHNYNRPTNYRPSSQITPRYTNYTSRYTSQQPEPSTRSAGGRNTVIKQGVEEFVIENRLDAANVLTKLVERADTYGSVSVADYYDLINVGSEYTDNNYGWTIDTIVSATIRPVRGGYVINFPMEEVL